MGTPLPDAADFTGASVTEGGFKTAITNLRAYLSGLFGATGEVKDLVGISRVVLEPPRTNSANDWFNLVDLALGASNNAHASIEYLLMVGDDAASGTSVYFTVDAHQATTGFDSANSSIKVTSMSGPSSDTIGADNLRLDGAGSANNETIGLWLQTQAANGAFTLIELGRHTDADATLSVTYNTAGSWEASPTFAAVTVDSDWAGVGTYTVNFYDASSGGNASATSTTGKYSIRNGICRATFSVSGLDVTGMTGANGLFFSLPFTPADDSTGAMYTSAVNLGTGRTAAVPRAVNGTARGSFVAYGSSVAASTVTVANASGGAFAFVELEYRVS